MHTSRSTFREQAMMTQTAFLAGRSVAALPGRARPSRSQVQHPCRREGCGGGGELARDRTRLCSPANAWQCSGC